MACAALLIYCWHISVPEPWRDEAVTVGVAHRSWAGLWTLLRHQDAVHGLYYAIVNSLVGVLPGPDSPERTLLIARLVSAACMAGVVALLPLLAAKARLPRYSGVVAAAVLMVHPWANRFAQEARPSALATLAVTLATLALLSLGARQASDLRYGAAIIAMALSSTITLLALVAHGVFAVALEPAVRRRWAAATLGALAALAPFLVLAVSQRAQVAWTVRPTLHSLMAGSYTLAGGTPTMAVMCASMIGLLAVALFRGAATPGALLVLAWSLAPPLLLFLLSQAHPFWSERYLTYVLPGVALAVGAGTGHAMSLLGRWRRRTSVMAATAALCACLLPGLMVDQALRAPHARGEDVVGVSTALCEHAHAGDGVLFVPNQLRILSQADPDSFSCVNDLTVAGDPAASSSVEGGQIAPNATGGAVLTASRVWVLSYDRDLPERSTATDQVARETLEACFQRGERLEFLGFALTAYTRRPGQC